MRYTNPATGADALTTLRMELHRLRPDAATDRTRTVGSAVWQVFEGEGSFGANGRRARPPQLVLLGPGDALAVTDTAPGTRFLLMAGRPYREMPVFNGPYVD